MCDVVANETPRCNLEKIALSIFQYHTSGAKFDPCNSGAEWWTLYLEHDDDVGFHWDRDYGLEDEFDKLVHPQLATVTYMSNVGGPTVVLDMPGNIQQQGYESYPLSSCIISKPVVGKHMVFDGLLLHGAPSDLHNTDDIETSSDEDTICTSENEENIPIQGATPAISNPRVTFLVNVWLNHIPTQSNTSLSPSLLTQLSTEEQCVISNDFSRRCSPVLFPSADDSVKDIIKTTKWTLADDDKSYWLEVPLPPEDALWRVQRDNGANVIQVDCRESPGRISVAQGGCISDRGDESDSSGSGDDASADGAGGAPASPSSDSGDGMARTKAESKSLPSRKRQRI